MSATVVWTLSSAFNAAISALAVVMSASAVCIRVSWSLRAAAITSSSLAISVATSAAVARPVSDVAVPGFHLPFSNVIPTEPRADVLISTSWLATPTYVSEPVFTERVGRASRVTVILPFSWDTAETYLPTSAVSVTSRASIAAVAAALASSISLYNPVAAAPPSTALVPIAVLLAATSAISWAPVSVSCTPANHLRTSLTVLIIVSASSTSLPISVSIAATLVSTPEIVPFNSSLAPFIRLSTDPVTVSAPSSFVTAAFTAA